MNIIYFNVYLVVPLFTYMTVSGCEDWLCMCAFHVYSKLLSDSTALMCSDAYTYTVMLLCVFI